MVGRLASGLLPSGRVLGALAHGALIASLCACGSSETSPWNTSTATGSPTGAGGQGATGGSGGAGAVGAQGGGGQGATGGSGGAGFCGVAPACDAAPPNPGQVEAWRHATTPITTTSLGDARHRGRDLFLRPGDPQWVIAKLAYGLSDKDLVDEDVDVHLLRDCGSEWELLGTATTTDDGDHETVEGVVDEGGLIFFPIPSTATLGLGRHRIHLVVKGDLTTADMFIEVVEAGTTLFVADVDGTLTTSENEQFYDLLTGATPEANPNSADALGRLAAKGLRPFYLTARPFWLVAQTHTFLAERGYPPGIVHTTLGFTGALNAAATTFKIDELAVVAAKELPVAWGFGNRDSDSQAYEAAGIQPLANRIFFQFDDTLGGRRIDDYAELLTQFDALPSLCP